MTDQLLEQSTAKRDDFFRTNQTLLKALAEHGQKPKALFVGCADSRVTPERLFGLQPGDFFMVRNVANTVPPYIQADMATIAALEFAVMELRVAHVVICGHTDCGGIKALDQPPAMSTHPSLSSWIELARPAQRDVDMAHSDLDANARHVAIVERHVVRQLDNVATYAFVQSAQAAGELALHGWVYDLKAPEMRYYDAAEQRFKTA